MKVLLDECLPRKLKTKIIGHDCVTVPEAGLAGMKNGELLSSAENMGFQMFITLDRGIQFSATTTQPKTRHPSSAPQKQSTG